MLTLTATLLDDINPNGGSNPSDFVGSNGLVFFAADDGVHGRELWATDGTAGGTRMVKDIYSKYGEEYGSSPSNLTDVNGTLFFTANDGIHGTELWKSNGTAQGTSMVKDIDPSNSTSPRDLTAAGNRLFFVESYGGSSISLWESDGSDNGTFLVPLNSDIVDVENLTSFDGGVVFTASGTTGGNEAVWRTDGTASGTELLASLGSYSPAWVVNASGEIYFASFDPTFGKAVNVYASNGTTAGTQIVKSFASWPYGQIYQSTAAVGTTLYFAADDGSTGLGSSGNELWKSDGTPSSTVLVKDVNPAVDPYSGNPVSSDPQWITNLNGEIFFSADDGADYRELWKTDGTADGTTPVVSADSIDASDPQNLIAVGDELFFVGDLTVPGPVLWATDGTSDGTLPVEAYPGVGFNDPEFSAFGAVLYFNGIQGDSFTTEPFTVTVTAPPAAPNQVPTFTAGSDQSVNENAGSVTVPGWATNISAGSGPLDIGQTLNFLVSTDNDSLFSATPKIDANGTLTYTPAPNVTGSATVTVQLHDNGGTDNGGVDTSPPQTFTISVLGPANRAPSFLAGPDQIVDETAGEQTVIGWATQISPGDGPDDVGQTLNFITSVQSTTNPNLFSVQPFLDSSGTLHYALADNQSGLATISVRLHDNGGTDNGGVDTSAPQTFTIGVRGGSIKIVSPNNATFIVGQRGSFSVIATGFPSPTITVSGSLPTGVTFDQQTGIIAGMPVSGTGDPYPITITADNGFGQDEQTFTLTVDQAPAIQSGDKATFTVGLTGSFSLAATGYPQPTWTYTGTLPAGVTFDAADGLLSGTPEAYTGGPYPLTFTASNGFDEADTQSFTLTVNQPPAITSAASTVFIVNTAGSFAINATGYPAAGYRKSGNLPSGVTFDELTGLLSGTPATGTGGDYPLVFTAGNGVATDATQSFLLHVQQPPSFVTGSSATFATGGANSLAILADGAPKPALTVNSPLPAGVSFDAASGVLSGTPPVGTKGSYALTFTASNGVGADAVLNFTLNIVDSHGLDFAAVPNSSSVAMDHFYWNSDAAGGGFTFTYNVTDPLGIAVPSVFLEFDWATGPDVSDAIAGATAYLATIDTPGEKSPGTHTVTVSQDQLIAGHRSPPLINGGLGTATDLLMRVDPPNANEPFGLVQETDENNNVAALRVVPLVVAVLSHGFKPDSGESWSDFRQPWYDLASELAHVPAADSTLDHRVAEYVTKWDSSTDFLNGFYAMLASKVASAEAQLVPAEAALLNIASAASLAVAAASAEGSDELLEQAAHNVVSDLESPGGDLLPPAQSNVLQHIELLGHSRGAALNAEVARLLWQDGYRNMDYTALDGYSSDWPDDGGILTSIDIAKDTAMLGDQRLFYRVQYGLEHDPAIVNNKFISALLGTQLDIIQAENDLRSPDRTGADQIVLPAGGYTISAHTTIEPIYASQPTYYENGFVGKHREDGLPAASASAQISTAAALAPGVAATILSTVTTSGNVSPAEIGTASPSEYESGFVDGSFQGLAALNAQIAAANLPTGATAFYQFLQQIADPAFQISLFWQTTGEVSLVTTGGTAALQLSNVAGADASISQSVVLPERATDVAFDLGVTSASPDSVLEVSYSGSVMQSFPLAGISGSQHVVVPLPDGVPDSGQFTFLLTSASQAPATITLANLTIDAAANTAPTLTVTTLSLPKIDSGADDASNFGAAVSTLLDGISDPDPGAVAGIAVVAADTTHGSVQYSLDGETTWQSVGAVSASNALLLDGNPLTRLRFVPEAGFAGQLSDVLTIRAWDQSMGLAAISSESYDIAATGGSSAFSSQTASVVINVSPAAHTPSISNATTYEAEQTSSGLIVTPSPADGAIAAYFQVSGITGGRLYLNDGLTPLADGNFVTAAQAAMGLRFTPTASSVAPGSFQIQASTTADGSGLGGQPVTAEITVLPVNHAPAFTAGGNVVTLDNGAPQTIKAWATSMSPGPGADDVGQSLTFVVTNDNSAMFSTQPSIDAAGTLHFTSKPNVVGAAKIMVVLKDDGGTLHGGIDTSAAQTFTLSVTRFALGDDIYAIGSGTISVPAQIGVLANDSGPGQLSVTSDNVTGTTGGTFTFHADGSFSYTPPIGFPGYDYASYLVSDARGDLTTATVNVISQTGGVVWKFYEQVLDRDPDYAGLQGWINDFLNGGQPGDIAAGFFESTELLNQIISGYYQQYLGRAPQGNDLDYWGKAWRENGGPELIKAQFASSQEFNTLANKLYGAYPDGWLTALYERILNRTPQGNDLPFWQQQLAGGLTEGQVALDFFTSPEAFGNDVSGWFDEYLGRAPTPDEQQQYANQMIGGASDRDIEQAITNLAEYAANPPDSPAGTGVRLPDYLPQAGSAKQQAAADAFFATL